MLLMTFPPLLASETTDGDSAPQSAQVKVIDINEYRVEGATKLSAVEIESAVYPFLGPGRELKDIELARASLEKKYADLGYHSVAVAIPPQKVRNGIVLLKVTEATVERLRVKGSRWFSIADIRQLAPSMAEGSVPNFNDIMKDIVVLNQLPDRQVIPELRAGATPGAVDVDLLVKDKFPLHGSLELNNRYSPSTPPLRLTGGIRYDNLWQLGHSLGFSFQVSPETQGPGPFISKSPTQKVFSLSYMARIPTVPWLSFSINGVLQDSDVSTLGGMAVKGRGKLAGLRAIFTLPAPSGFSHNLLSGLDYKNFEEGLTLDTSTINTPINYLTMSAQYTFRWADKSTQVNCSASVLFNIRPFSSGLFDSKRYQASSNFTTIRTELSVTQELFFGMQLFARGNGQYANQPVLGSEQIVAGGVASVRGYLEAEAAGDYGAVGTIELRSPDLSVWIKNPLLTNARFLLFFEGGFLELHKPLPEQLARFTPGSAGGGLRLELLETLQMSVDAGLPLARVGTTKTHQARWHFSMLGQF